ncbi:uncharacterized protein LOC142098617 [Mixophyes fleayi]|uniref:uncharacterized protein LOC142098617 n=1 Tax=Mixophyes fleayi TaxID=3061075 RepID=UPI003F4DC99E
MTEDEDPRERINRYIPGGTLLNSTHRYQRVSLQLFGMTGHGKSSLINSCVCVVKDEDYLNLAGAGQTDGGLTTSRQEYELTNRLVMIDNRGFKNLNSQEILEACAQLRSLRGIGDVTWEKDNLAETLKQIPDKFSKRPDDFFVPVLVYSATQSWSAEDGKAIQPLITNAFQITGIHPIVVITNCTAEDSNEIKRKFGDLGVMKRVCVENYTENDHDRSIEQDRMILDFLNVCIEEAERGIKTKQGEDPQARFVTQIPK